MYGKTQLAREGLTLASSEYMTDVETGRADAGGLAGAVVAMIAPWRQLLLDND